MTASARSTPFAPAALTALYERIRLSHPHHHIALGGILGDASHSYGYHLARAVLPPTDYSVQLPDDKLGSPWAASAIDLTPDDQQVLITLTTRMARAVARGDLRVFSVVREFYGTVDGQKVFGYDLAERRPATSDTSHLWHLHISFYRRYSQRPRLLAGVADVLADRRHQGSGG